MALADLPPPRRIKWLREQDNSSKLCFATVDGMQQLSDFIRFCSAQPQCVRGYDVRADLSKQAKEQAPPELYLRFGGQVGRVEQADVRADVFALARRAGVHEPVNLSFMVGDNRVCFLRYILHAHAQAFLQHCQQQPHCTARDGSALSLTCSWSGKKDA